MYCMDTVSLVSSCSCGILFYEVLNCCSWLFVWPYCYLGSACGTCFGIVVLLCWFGSYGRLCSSVVV